MNKPGRPQILINASDLGHGVRFTFIQEYFNLLCSDLSSYPVARAVTASSAVPVLFHPVVVENYADCGFSKPEWLHIAEERAETDPELAMTVSGLASHFIQFGFRDVHEPELRLFFHTVPTSFYLSDEQVDKLIQAGRELLRRDPDFQNMFSQLGGHDKPDVARQTVNSNVVKNVGWDERSESRHRPTAASGFATLIPTYEVAGSHR